MTRSSIALLLATALFACRGREAAPPAPAPQPLAPSAPPVDAQAFRHERPAAIGPVPELHAPVPDHRVLANGLAVLTVQKRGLPLVHVRVVVLAGSAADPAQLPGLAGFVGDMLKAGTKTRSAQQLADEIETLGTTLDVSVDEDATALSFSVLAQNLQPALDVLADVITAPAFAPAEIERVRKRRLAALAEERDDPPSLADRTLKHVVFGAHPYGHSVLGDEKAVGTIDAAALAAFYRQHVRPANAAAIVVGDIEPQAAYAAIDERLGSWRGAPGMQPVPAAPKPQPAEVVLVERAAAPQSQIRVAEIGVARLDPDYFPLVMMNAVLGGLFNSRINMKLREEKGYTYGAHSYFDFTRAPGSFVVDTGVRTEVTAPAVGDILAEIARMRATDVTSEELSQAKNSYSLSLPGMFQSVGRVGGMMANIYTYGLPLDYYQQLPARLTAVSVADVRRVAEAHLRPEQLSIIVVGDRKVEVGLAELGRGAVEVRGVPR